MSKGYWQTERQREQFDSGGSTTRRVRDYCQTWRRRCYSDGIPDEVPALLDRANRAPSWKAIATCILQNDLKLRGLGFSPAEFINMGKESSDPQLGLFDE